MKPILMLVRALDKKDLGILSDYEMFEIYISGILEKFFTTDPLQQALKNIILAKFDI